MAKKNVFFSEFFCETPQLTLRAECSKIDHCLMKFGFYEKISVNFRSKKHGNDNGRFGVTAMEVV